jgi:hypothetical protein
MNELTVTGWLTFGLDKIIIPQNAFGVPIYTASFQNIFLNHGNADSYLIIVVYVTCIYMSDDAKLNKTMSTHYKNKINNVNAMLWPTYTYNINLVSVECNTVLRHRWFTNTPWHGLVEVPCAMETCIPHHVMAIAFHIYSNLISILVSRCSNTHNWTHGQWISRSVQDVDIHGLKWFQCPCCTYSTYNDMTHGNPEAQTISVGQHALTLCPWISNMVSFCYKSLLKLYNFLQHLYTTVWIGEPYLEIIWTWYWYFQSLGFCKFVAIVIVLLLYFSSPKLFKALCGIPRLIYRNETLWVISGPSDLECQTLCGNCSSGSSGNCSEL